MKRWAVILTAVAMATSSVEAATLSAADGDVLVSSGNGFKRATVGQELRPGDRIMVGSLGGSAAISYEQACSENVGKGQVVTVKPFSPCSADSGNGDTVNQSRGRGNTGGTGGGTTGDAPVGDGSNGALIAGGAALVVGGGVIIYQATKGSSP